MWFTKNCNSNKNAGQKKNMGPKNILGQTPPERPVGATKGMTGQDRSQSGHPKATAVL